MIATKTPGTKPDRTTELRTESSQPDQREVTGVRWDQVMRARDRVADDLQDEAMVLRDIADRLAVTLESLEYRQGERESS